MSFGASEMWHFERRANVKVQALVPLGLLALPPLLVSLVSVGQTSSLIPAGPIPLVVVSGLIGMLVVPASVYLGKGAFRRPRATSLALVVAVEVLLFAMTLRDRYVSNLDIAESSFFLPVAVSIALFLSLPYVAWRLSFWYLAAVLATLLTVIAGIGLLWSSACRGTFSQVLGPEWCVNVAILGRPLGVENLNLAVYGLLMLATFPVVPKSTYRVGIALVGSGLLMTSGSRSSLIAGLAVLVAWIVISLLKNEKLEVASVLSVTLAIGLLLGFGAFEANKVRQVMVASEATLPCQELSPSGDPSLLEAVSTTQDCVDASKERTNSGYRNTTPQGFVAQALNQRTDIWAEHWRLVSADPWRIFGRSSAEMMEKLNINLKNRRASALPPNFGSAHNLLLDTWHRFGLLGFGLLGTLLIASSMLAWRAYRNARFFPGIGFLVGILTLSITDTVLSWSEISASVFLWNFILFWAWAERESFQVPSNE